MRLGKLTNDELSAMILENLTPVRDDVILRPGVGEDCGAIAFGDLACVVSTDPITVPTADAGTLAIQVSVNDVAAAGAQPVAALLTLLAPPSADIEQLRTLVCQAQNRARREGIEIIGGHTEVTDAVNRVVLSVTVLGKAQRTQPLGATGAKPGDALIMTKTAAIEGTRILLGEKGLFLSPRLSVSAEAAIGAKLGAHAMHDATEGGILGASWEMAQAAGLGITIDADSIPILPETRAVCEARGLDPLRLIASGSLLIAHPDGPSMVAALAHEGILATCIGIFTENNDRILVKNGQPGELAPPESDEIYKV